MRPSPRRDKRRAPPDDAAPRPAAPLAITLPSAITVRRSATANTASMSCSTSSTALPARNCPMNAVMARESAPLMPASGSSSSATFGSVAITIAISSWRCSPWLSAPARVARPLAEADLVQRQHGALAQRALGRRAAQQRQRRGAMRLHGEPHVLEHAGVGEDHGLLVRAADAEQAALGGVERA